jgi:hypothetical protein
MKIFLTGGSGFVGGAVLRQLGEKHAIRALSRSHASDEKIARYGAAVVRGDLQTVDAVMLAGAEAVIHCAAYVEEWGELKTYRAINVEGTRRLLDAARRAGARRFIHISTEAALFHGQHMRDVDETAPLALNSPFPYSRTKAEAEVAVVAANDPVHGFETVILRPRLIWGEGDETVLPVVADMIAKKRFLWIDGGRAKTSTTHIDNLIRAIDLALTKGEGAYFVVDGAPTTFKDFLTRYLATAGVTPPNASMPGLAARTLADLIEPLFRLAGARSAPPVTRFAAHIMSRDCTINDAKARAALGYAPVVTLEAGFARLSKSRSPR